MENKTSIKNMELVLLEIRRNVMTNGSDTRAPKTLIHSYLTLLKEFERMSSDEQRSVVGSLGVQADQLQIIKHYIKEDKMQELFKLNDYVGINNYATVLDKVSQALDSIGVPSRSLYTPSKLIEDLLDSSIKTGTLVTFYDETHRGMGKTTALIKKANELDVVLVVGIHSQAKQVHAMAKEMGLSIRAISATQATSTMDDQHRQKMKENGYLVDEMVRMEDLKLLKNYKLLGGFSRIVI